MLREIEEAAEFFGFEITNVVKRLVYLVPQKEGVVRDKLLAKPSRPSEERGWVVAHRIDGWDLKGGCVFLESERDEYVVGGAGAVMHKCRSAIETVALIKASLEEMYGDDL